MQSKRIIRDTFSCWSGFGQAVILCMIQIGGLGLMTVISLGFLFSAGDHIVTVGKEEDIRRLTSKS